MNEFELQAVVMQARKIKPADKFVMICILKNVNWSTWKGTVTLSYLSKKYDINRRTLSRIIQRLKIIDWISVFTKDDETIINVNISSISNHERLDKMSSETRQNVHTGIDKMSSETRQNVHEALDKMTSETRQNVYHNNTYNNNTIYNNEEESQGIESKEQNSRAYYRDLYLELYKVDIDQPLSYMDQGDIDFIVEYDIIPSWKRLDQYSKQDLRDELRKRATCLNIPTQSMMLFFNKEKKRELS
jgi:hypothetical protein